MNICNVPQQNVSGCLPGSMEGGIPGSISFQTTAKVKVEGPGEEPNGWFVMEEFFVRTQSSQKDKDAGQDRKEHPEHSGKWRNIPKAG